MTSIFGIAAILLMFSWIDDSHGIGELTDFMIVTVWMGVPDCALAGTAVFFRRSLLASLVVLAAVLANDFFATSFMYFHEQHFFRPVDPNVITMNCGPPPELFLPML